MKIKLYVQAVKWAFDQEFSIKASVHHSKTDSNRVVIDICERIVNIEVPEIDQAFLINGEVEQLEVAIKKEQERSLSVVIALQEKKASLLCIENGAEQ